MRNKAQHPRKESRSRQRDDQPHLDPGALGGVCGCPCPQVHEVRQGTETAPNCPTTQYRPVQADLGADLGTRGAEGDEMKTLNWGYIQLGLVALVLASSGLVDR